jgi:hypothetical protein
MAAATASTAAICSAGTSPGARFRREGPLSLVRAAARAPVLGAACLPVLPGTLPLAPAPLAVRPDGLVVFLPGLRVAMARFRGWTGH